MIRKQIQNKKTYSWIRIVNDSNAFVADEDSFFSSKRWIEIWRPSNWFPTIIIFITLWFSDDLVGILFLDIHILTNSPITQSPLTNAIDWILSSHSIAHFYIIHTFLIHTYSFLKGNTIFFSTITFSQLPAFTVISLLTCWRRGTSFFTSQLFLYTIHTLIFLLIRSMNGSSFSNHFITVSWNTHTRIKHFL